MKVRTHSVHFSNVVQPTDLTGLICTTDRCPVITGNSLGYADANHVTPYYSQLLAPVIGALTDGALAGS